MTLAQQREQEQLLTELRRLHGPGVGYLLRRFRLCGADAEDIVAVVTVRVYNHYRNNRIESISAFYFQSLHNRAVDVLRSRGSKPRECGLEAVSDQAAPGDPADEVLYLELQDAIERCLTDWQARPATQRAFRLRLRGHTVPEVADLVGISLPAAKKAVHRGMQLLRKDPRIRELAGL